MNRSRFLVPVLVCICGFLAGCRYELDRLYALPLEDAPTEEDWAGLPVLQVEAVGGRTTIARESEVDGDAVHATTASCHHGAEMPPVMVDLQAFWTPEHLYLRVSWADPTENRGPVWTWTGTGWTAEDRWEDGLGLLWGPPGEAFQCSRYCHLEDWRMAGERSFADYAMATPDGGGERDFWVWRPGRGALEGSVEDATLGSQGRRGDGNGPDESYVPNSVRAEANIAGTFEAGDAPRVHPAPEPGLRVPGYVDVPVPPGRSEVEVRSRWEGGRWSVVLKRELPASEPGDVSFRPGGDAPFGLAILDAVERDHLAVAEPVRLRLVSREEMRNTADRLEIR